MTAQPGARVRIWGGRVAHIVAGTLADCTDTVCGRIEPANSRWAPTPAAPDLPLCAECARVEKQTGGFEAPDKLAPTPKDLQ